MSNPADKNKYVEQDTCHFYNQDPLDPDFGQQLADSARSIRDFIGEVAIAVINSKRETAVDDSEYQARP